MHQTPQTTLKLQPETLFSFCTRETPFSQFVGCHSSASTNVPTQGLHQTPATTSELQQEILFSTFTYESSCLQSAGSTSASTNAPISTPHSTDLSQGTVSLFDGWEDPF